MRAYPLNPTWQRPLAQDGQSFGTAVFVPAEQIDYRIVWLTLLALGYNALLAIFNAHVAGIGFSAVAASEIVILAACVLVLLRSGLTPDSANTLWFCCGFLGLALLVSLLNEKIFVDAFRNALIITIFVCLGRRINFKTLDRTVLVCSTVVLGFLILELSSLTTYAGFFRPAQYFFATRGTEEFELDDSGLFRNALGFAGRFSFGIFDGPRTSSIFLEQVSAANYAGVLCVFLLALWPHLGKWSRLIHASTAILIIVSNNTRTTSILFLVSVMGYWIYPRLPKYLNVLLAPAIICMGVVVYLANPYAAGDDLVGRIAHTGQIIVKMGFAEYAGMRISELGKLMDSGYPYVIYSSTVLGLILHWLYVCFIVPQHTPEQRRCAYGLAVYTFMNLLIGGTAIFSIKVSAVLWLLVGFMSAPQRNSVLSTHSFAPVSGTVKP